MVAVTSLSARAGALQVDTPAQPPVQCVPYQFTWERGEPPFVLLVISDTSPRMRLERFTGITENSIEWPSDIPAGTTIFFKVRDSTGAHMKTRAMTVQRGSTDSCLAGTPAPSPSASSPISNSATSITSAPSLIPQSSSQPMTWTTIPSANRENVNAQTAGHQPVSSGDSAVPLSSPTHATASPSTALAPTTVPNLSSSSSNTLSSPNSAPLASSGSGYAAASAIPQQAGASRSLSTGGIVGVVVGTILALSIVFVLLVWYLRRSRLRSGSLSRPGYLSVLSTEILCLPR
ncbi:hypothetical protein BV20DRAFT_87327 [Pilatotrama ljubarskyi]|nr:hypothetical protein BV20DRAFT_87327 [Pilatotrama ljubarskyi]